MAPLLAAARSHCSFLPSTFYSRFRGPFLTSRSLVLDLATRADVEACLHLLHAHGETEHIALGVVAWTHPGVRRLVEGDADAGQLYAVRDGGRVVATFALCEDPDPYYVAARWAHPQARATYLHRIVVAADRQGTGLGTWCVRRAEELAAGMGFTFLRLDTLEHDARAVNFYHRLGYADCGVAPVESGEPSNPIVNLVCMEKPLSAKTDSSLEAS